jgi:hypothetical protein
MIEKNYSTGTAKINPYPYSTVNLPSYFTKFADKFYYSMECYSSYGVSNKTEISPFNAWVVAKINEV